MAFLGNGLEYGGLSVDSALGLGYPGGGALSNIDTTERFDIALENEIKMTMENITNDRMCWLI